MLQSPGTELQPLKPACSQQEEPLQGEARELQLEHGPHGLQLEMGLHSNTDPAQPKI